MHPLFRPIPPQAKPGAFDRNGSMHSFMSLLWWIIAFSLLGSAGVVLVAGLLLLVGDVVRRHVLPWLVSFAVGTLLGAAFLGMLPRALDLSDARKVLGAVLAGLLLFFVLEKWVLWRHCHDQECSVHSSTGMLILLGDAIHNFLDGFAIAAAFKVSVPLGISTSLAVIAHEIPQEAGDFAILLSSGYPRGRALGYNVLSSLTTLPGALIAYFAILPVSALLPYILALAAASFIYIAVADLIPGLHRHTGRRATVYQLVFVLTGIGIIFALQSH